MNAVLKLSRIRQIAIAVTDVASALVFYRDVLGLEYLFSAGQDLVFLAAGDIRMMLTTGGGKARPGANSILYFAVSDIESAHSELVDRGAKDERGPRITATMPDHELWTAFVRDPEGNLIGLMEERR